MTPIFPVQFRSFDHVYLFKEKGKEYSLKIFDISQKLLIKKSFSKEQIQLSDQKKNAAIIPNFLEILATKNLLPSEYSLKLRVMQDYKQTSLQLIQKFKPTVIVESKELDKLTCPLTQLTFVDPVIDKCGHSFEKEFINTHLKNDSKCPINRKKLISVNELVPNLIIKQTVDEYQKQEPILNFSLFKEENSKRAQAFLKIAREFVKEGEEEDALDSFSKAFQYTKRWQDYVDIPVLYKSLKKYEKATLAYFYLAHYQLHDEKFEEAIHTLETCKESKLAPSLIDILLIQLFLASNQTEKAVVHILISKTALVENDSLAIPLIQNILIHNPLFFDIYVPLIDITKKVQERAHISFKGACHALANKYYFHAAEFFHSVSEKIQIPISFLDKCIHLDLLISKETNNFFYRMELLELSNQYEKANDHLLTVKVNKLLDQLEHKIVYCEKIVQNYEKLQKKEKLAHWYRQLLRLYIESKDWQIAEEIALKTLDLTHEADHLLLYESLETIYSHWNEPKLENLWSKLGQVYHKNGRLTEAEATYKKAYEKFPSYEHSCALADVLKAQKKYHESVQIYYETAGLAILKGQIDKIDRCISEIEKIDPSLKELEEQQRINLMLQKNLLSLTQQFKNSEEKRKQLSEKVQKENDNLIYLKRIKKSQNLDPKETNTSEPTHLANNESPWYTSLGIVIDEPDLPANLSEILFRDCPFFTSNNNKEQELMIIQSHDIFLMPDMVNGNPLTLQKLIELPKLNDQEYSIINRTQIDNILDFKITNKNVKPHWFLITRIPYKKISNSQDFSFKKCEEYVNNCAKKSSLAYQIATFEYVLLAQLFSNNYKYNHTYSRYDKKEIISYHHRTFNTDSLRLHNHSKYNIQGSEKVQPPDIFVILKL
jgi:tetratricopeptide (TPR) repeat protein